MRRLTDMAAGTHDMYGTFLRLLSKSIFIFDQGDLDLLIKARRSELGDPGLSDAEVFSSIKHKHLLKHCRRKTRGKEEM